MVESGPAWESGVRRGEREDDRLRSHDCVPGDVIVTVNDWLIVLMDRAQVIFVLFNAMKGRLC